MSTAAACFFSVASLSLPPTSRGRCVLLCRPMKITGKWGSSAQQGYDDCMTRAATGGDSGWENDAEVAGTKVYKMCKRIRRLTITTTTKTTIHTRRDDIFRVNSFFIRHISRQNHDATVLYWFVEHGMHLEL